MFRERNLTEGGKSQLRAKRLALFVAALSVTSGASLVSLTVIATPTARGQVTTTPYTLCVPTAKSVTDVEMTVDAQIVLSRLQLGFGLAGAEVSLSGQRCIDAALPIVPKQNSILSAVIKPGYLALANSDDQPLQPAASVRLRCKQKGCAPGVKVGKTNLRSRPPTLQIIIPQTEVQQGSATVARDSGGFPTVTYSLDAPGGDAWCGYTKGHIGGFVAIVVDNKIVSDPQVEDAICGHQTQVAGLSTQFEAQRVAAYLNFGALPLPLRLVTIN